MEEDRRKRASAILVKDGKILLLRRVKPDREYFIFPGGGVEKGEGVEEALTREVKEELSLEIKKWRFLFGVEDLAVPSGTTIHKGDRDEYYFLIEEYAGIPEIGGPEKERMNEQNQYHIAWLGLDEAEKMENIYPREGVRKLLSFLRNDR
jgi:8-oxo-dGTP pyrophosphatase MutT (NUDIX family)